MKGILDLISVEAIQAVNKAWSLVIEDLSKENEMSKPNEQEIAVHKKWIRWHQNGIGKCELEVKGYQDMIEYHRERIKERQDLIGGKPVRGE